MGSIKHSRLVGTLGVALLATPVHGQTAPAGGVTLDAAIRMALRENVDVLASGSLVDSANAERRIAGAVPNPVLAGTPNSPYQYSATIALDVTPQRRYRTQVASRGAEAVGFDRRDTERQVTVAVARAFFDALLSQERLRLAIEHRDAIAEILCADSARYAAGDVPSLALARSEVELVRADADLERARGDVRAQHLALQNVIGAVHADTSFAALGSLDYQSSKLTTDSVVSVALTHRPDVSAASVRVAQSDAAQHSSASLLFPTPSLSYVRQRTGPFDNGHYYSFGLQFELPSLNLYRGERERSAAGANMARLNERRASAQAERDVVSALADYTANRRLVERYRAGLLVKVDSGVSAVQYAYSRGAVSLLDVFDAVRAQRDVRTEYLTALHDYWVSVYSLNAAAASEVVEIVP